MDAGIGGQIGFNLGATGSSQVMFMAGSAPGVLSNGGCTFWLAPFPLSFGFSATYPQTVLSIPYDTDLVDATLFFQFLDVNPGGSFFGIGQMSDAIAVRLGGPFSR